MDLLVQKFSEVGLTPAFSAAAATGDTFTNNGSTYLFVKNQDAAAMNVTVESATKCSQGFDHDLVVAVAAGTTEQIGPLPANRFNDAQGKVSVSYSAVTSVTVAVVSSV